MWHYFLNWTGPTNVEFLRRHGAHWSTGHIEAWCDNLDDPNYRPEGYQYSLPIIHSDDWERLSEWIGDLETTFLWPKEQLLLSFESTHPMLPTLEDKTPNN